MAKRNLGLDTTYLIQNYTTIVPYCDQKRNCLNLFVPLPIGAGGTPVCRVRAEASSDSTHGVGLGPVANASYSTKRLGKRNAPGRLSGAAPPSESGWRLTGVCGTH